LSEKVIFLLAVVENEFWGFVILKKITAVTSVDDYRHLNTLHATIIDK